MKVYIGPYKNYFGPYQLAELLCFWVKDEKDKYGIKSKPDWVHNFGQWLAYGKSGKSYTPTFLNRFLTWINSFRHRRVYVKIDKYDTWSMNSQLALIVLPMLRQLRETKHGYPLGIDDGDVPAKFHTAFNSLQLHNAFDQLDLFPETKDFVDSAESNNAEMRWDWVLDEMIWAFEQLNSDWEEQFHVNGFDKDGFKIHSDRIDNGLRLFGKYYRALWD